MSTARTSIITYDEIGGYPHPDHIMTHKVAVEAFEKADDPDAYVGEGEPWTPLKLYYDRAFNPERTLTLHEHLLDMHGESLLSGWIETSRTAPPRGRHLATRLRPASW